MSVYDRLCGIAGTIIVQATGYATLAFVAWLSGEPFTVAKLIAFTVIAIAVAVLLVIAGLVIEGVKAQKDHP